MRKAIWEHYSNELNLDTVEIDITKNDAKSIWDKLEKYLPIYNLFQSDRKNSDGDNEVQDPLKVATKEFLSEPEIQEQLHCIAERVIEKLKTVSDSTLEKLQEIDSSFISSLNPEFPNSNNLKWADVFKVASIVSENDIPINKRGSGVKRLILLSFFRVQAERRRENYNNSIIYAIEEPETSQHTKNQIILINALKEIAQTPNTQVLITTHSSKIVKALDFENIRLIKNDDNGNKSINKIDKAVLPYPSLNEINFQAFDEISEEYHDELFGHIEYKGWSNELKNTDIEKRRYFKRETTNGTDLILPVYIRHQIHHPENDRNERYNPEDLRKSLLHMRNFIINKQNTNS